MIAKFFGADQEAGYQGSEVLGAITVLAPPTLLAQIISHYLSLTT